MIAALIFIALAAGAQVQAFPRSDPAAEALALAVLPEHAELLGARFGADVFCFIGYLDQIQKLVASAKKDFPLIEAALATLVTNVQACANKQESLYPKFECGLQAVRDSWEGSHELRDAALALAEAAAALAKKIKEDCFKSASFLQQQTVY